MGCYIQHGDYDNESKSEVCSALSNSLWPHGLCSSWNSPGQNTGVGSCSLLQGIFPTQGLNPGLPHCRWILYRLSDQGSPRILKWIAYPFCFTFLHLLNSEVEPGCPALQVDSLPAELPEKPNYGNTLLYIWRLLRE